MVCVTFTNVHYRKVANRSMSWLVVHQRTVYEGKTELNSLLFAINHGLIKADCLCELSQFISMQNLLFWKQLLPRIDPNRFNFISFFGDFCLKVFLMTE